MNKTLEEYRLATDISMFLADKLNKCRGRARGTTCSARIGTGRGAQMGTAYSAQ